MTDTTPITHTPRIEATVVRSAEGPFIGQISVDGAITTVEGRTEDGVRRDIIRAVASVAQRLARPVRLIARDSLGTQEVSVNPDGYTQALTPVAPTPPAALDFDTIIGLGSNPAHSAATAHIDDDDDTLAQPARRSAAVPDLDYLFRSDEDEIDDEITASAPVAAATSIAADPVTPAAAPAPTAAPAPAAARAPAARPQTPDPVLTPAGTTHAPTLDDFMALRPATPTAPAEYGWQGAVRRLSGGLISPAPGAAERARRRAVDTIQKPFDGPRTIVVINPKGGAHKTTATMLLAATFGAQRGGYTLAWDNNETRGTLGWRARPAKHQNTAVTLLGSLGRFADPATARVGDLDEFVRNQGSARFDVLASDEDPNATSLIDAEAYRQLHGTLQRFYRLIVVDTGNNMRAANWLAAVESADQLVIVSTVREDTAASAAWLVDGLREKGLDDKVADAVTVLSSPSESADPQLARRLKGHFGSLTRAVVEVPHDPALVDGGAITFELLSKRTKEAWLRVAATVAEGL